MLKTDRFNIKIRMSETKPVIDLYWQTDEGGHQTGLSYEKFRNDILTEEERTELSLNGTLVYMAEKIMMMTAQSKTRTDAVFNITGAFCAASTYLPYGQRGEEIRARFCDLMHEMKEAVLEEVGQC